MKVIAIFLLAQASQLDLLLQEGSLDLVVGREAMPLPGLTQVEVGVLRLLVGANPARADECLHVVRTTGKRQVPLAHSLEGHVDDAARRDHGLHGEVDCPEVLSHA